MNKTINSQGLILTLKNQHRALQADLSLVLEKIEVGGLGDEIVLNLTKFKNDLLEHLKLENETFYPDYLEKKIKRGEEVDTTKKFIKEMDEIGKVVIGFLEKYATAETISKSLLEFKKELISIINTLNMRIESEEDGVFGLYLLL